ncbi:hypothetical protein [Myroides sp. LoEW2-1]|uniref:hypothetical protein n=1 Tax=Myroides sp. LoEW2-1 TaxID=2683192 RepID=UPI00132979D9|nr:hypothetical protein [Myroides sp. LoEW2-1]MVX37242.1 hypothetical protein [Myroides sp. LoEW2-1]
MDNNSTIFIVKQYSSKLKNKRVSVDLIYDSKKDLHSVIVKTRTLQDFKNRTISETVMFYSIETFITLSSMFEAFIKDSKNKELLREISNLFKLNVKQISYKHPKY